MKLRNLFILIVLAGAVVAAAVMLRETPETSSVDATSYYPDLKAKLNDVTSIRGQSGEKIMTIVRKENDWLLKERGDYPVDRQKVRAFLKGLSELVRLEAKTENPELYGKLDLEDPSAADTKAIQFTVSVEGDEAVADIIIGKDRSSTSDLDKRDLYVRTPGDPKTWLVESDIEIFRSELDWMDRTIVNIHRDRIEQLFVDHPLGDDVFVSRDSPDVPDYTLKDIAEDEQLEYKFQLKDMANAFTSLDFDDVAVEEGIDFESENALSATLDTFDGMRVVMQVGDKDGERWARFRADESGRDITVEMSLSDQLKSKEDVAAQVITLNAAWEGWIYRVRDFKFESITRSKSELVNDGTAPADDLGQSGADPLLLPPLSEDTDGSGAYPPLNPPLMPPLSNDSDDSGGLGELNLNQSGSAGESGDSGNDESQTSEKNN